MARRRLSPRHYYEEADPDRALAMLEDEMSEVWGFLIRRHSPLCSLSTVFLHAGR